MTSNHSQNNDFESVSPNHPDPSSSVNTMQRDRFELLSAYLDGEVTAAERKQVEQWLTTDPTMQRLHSRLLKLRQGFQALPVPAPSQTSQQMADQIFAKVERRSNRRRLVWVGATAAMVVGALTTLVGGDRSFMPQVAKSPEQVTTPQQETASEPLMIALDKPVVEIPKAPVAAPQPTKSLETPRNPADNAQ